MQLQVFDRKDKSWIPPDPGYGIIYEMEHIESSSGVYYSTEGFLRLLCSLFSVGGCPSNLGQNWRNRTGCSPYIEYVIHLVLPRTVGLFANLPALPFRSSEDRSRLAALALEVIEAVMTRYVLPLSSHENISSLSESDATESYTKILSAANDNLGQPELAASVSIRPCLDDVKLFVSDFSPKVASTPSTETTSESGTATPQFQRQPTHSIARAMPGSEGIDVPRPKTPAFTIFTDILTSRGGRLFDALVSLLEAPNIIIDNSSEADMMALVYALFGNLQPSFATAKEGKKIERSTSATQREALLKVLRPKYDHPSASEAVYWSERVVLLVLRVLCATITREKALRLAFTHLPDQTSMVPVLNFKKRFAVPSSLSVIDLQLSRLSQLLLSSDNKSGVLSTMILLVGYTSLSSQGVDIAAAAVAIILSVHGSLPPQQGVETLLRNSAEGEIRLARSFSRRLVASSNKFDSAPDLELLRVILDHIMSDLRKHPDSDDSLSRVLLGLPSVNSKGTWEANAISREPRDCFDALLQLVSNERFIAASKSSELASYCYEIFVRLCSLPTESDAGFRRALYSATRLRSMNFWKDNLVKLSCFCGALPPVSPSRFLHGVLKGDEHVIHSISWLLKGIAVELRFLAGFANPNSGLGRYGALLSPHPSHCKQLLDVLFTAPSEILLNLVNIIPIIRVDFDSASVVPSEQAIQRAKRQLTGAPEVFEGYESVDNNELLKATKETWKSVNEEGLHDWSARWNLSVSRDCASAHLSDAIHLVVGASLVGIKAFKDIFRIDSMSGYSFLAVILDHLTNIGQGSLDDVCFTTATRNLALAALAATELSLTTQQHRAGCVDAPAACALLARAVSRSGAGSKAGQNINRKNERTVILGSALVMMLHERGGGDASVFSGAAVALARLSCHVIFDRSTATPLTETRLARSCFSLLLENLEEEVAQSILDEKVSNGSGQSLVRSFIYLLESLDYDVPKLLQQIAGFQFGREQLLNEGIMEALHLAAKKYLQEEKELLKTMDSQPSSMSKHNVDIQSPSFLLGHLELMSSLLASSTAKDNPRKLFTEVKTVLRCYGPIIRRFLSRFPVEGDLAKALFRCMAQMKVLTMNISDPFVFLPAGQQSSLGFENEFATLTIQIAENPLPLEHLKALPPSLTNAQARSTSGAVSLCNSTDESWWDRLNIKGVHSGCNDVDEAISIYGSCLSAIDLVRDGLFVIQGSSSTSALNVFGLARAICRCVQVSRVSPFVSH